MKKAFLFLLVFFAISPICYSATRTITVPTGYYYNRPYYNSPYYGRNYYYNNYPAYTTTTVYPKNYTSSSMVNSGYGMPNPRDILIGVSNKGTRIISPQYTTRTYYPGGRTKTNYYTPQYTNMYIPMRYGY